MKFVVAIVLALSAATVVTAFTNEEPPDPIVETVVVNGHARFMDAARADRSEREPVLEKPKPASTPEPPPPPEPVASTNGSSVAGEPPPQGSAQVIDCDILNPDLALVCDNESSGSTHAYNADGCIGGCYGIFQMSGEYMDTWAIRAGYPDYAYAGFWPADVQIAVATHMYNQPGGLETYWCSHTDYC